MSRSSPPRYRNPVEYGKPAGFKHYGKMQQSGSTSPSVTGPTAPSNAAVTQTSRTACTVTWTDNSSDEDTFTVERKDSGAYSVLDDTLVAGTTSYVDSTVSIGTEYTYRVKAVNSSGSSDYSTTSAITPSYQYGYPAYGSSESNVSLQFLFDESSGDIVDEVDGLTCSAVNSGAITYSQAVTGAYAGLSPGIKYDAAVAVGHRKTGDTAHHINLSDFTYECWFSSTDTASSDNMLYHIESTAGENPPFGSIYYANLRPSLNIFQIYFYAGNTRVANITVANSVYTDGVPHKVRITNDRSGNLELFIDGTSYGTSDVSPMEPYPLYNNTLNLSGGANKAKNTLYETRISLNLTNNSGGTGGG